MADNMAQSGKLVKGISATYVEEMSIKTPERYEIRCITREVQAVIGRSGIDDGIVLVNPMHITASVYVNDLEYGLHHDIMHTLEKLAPYHGPEGKSGAGRRDRESRGHDQSEVRRPGACLRLRRRRFRGGYRRRY